MEAMVTKKGVIVPEEEYATTRMDCANASLGTMEAVILSTLHSSS